MITTILKGPCLGSYSILCLYFPWAILLELTVLHSLGKASDCFQVRLQDYLGDAMFESHFVLLGWMCQIRYLVLRTSGLELWSRPFPWCSLMLWEAINLDQIHCWFSRLLAVNSLLLHTSCCFLVLLLYLFLLFTVHAGFNYLNCFWGSFFSQKKSHYCPSVNYINPSWEARDYTPKTFLWKTPAVSYFVDLFLPWAILRSKVVAFIEWWGVWGLRNPSLQFSTYLIILGNKVSQKAPSSNLPLF